MSKVLVDRELLERLERSYMDGMSIYGECEELRAILAVQPAEAEGVEVVAWTWQGTLDRLKGYCPRGEAVWPHQTPGTPIGLMRVDQHLAALAAERDALREDRDSQQRVCIAEMEKVSQLRAEVDRLRNELAGKPLVY